MVKNPPANSGDVSYVGSILRSGRPPWRRKWQSTPVFLPGKSQGQRRLLGYSPWVYKESDAAEACTQSCHPYSNLSLKCIYKLLQSYWKLLGNMLISLQYLLYLFSTFSLPMLCYTLCQLIYSDSSVFCLFVCFFNFIPLYKSHRYPYWNSMQHSLFYKSLSSLYSQSQLPCMVSYFLRVTEKSTGFTFIAFTFIFNLLGLAITMCSLSHI